MNSIDIDKVYSDTISNRAQSIERFTQEIQWYCDRNTEKVKALKALVLQAYEDLIDLGLDLSDYPSTWVEEVSMSTIRTGELNIDIIPYRVDDIQLDLWHERYEEVLARRGADSCVSEYRNNLDLPSYLTVHRASTCDGFVCSIQMRVHYNPEEL
jgi:hypothetical protein